MTVGQLIERLTRPAYQDGHYSVVLPGGATLGISIYHNHTDIRVWVPRTTDSDVGWSDNHDAGHVIAIRMSDHGPTANLWPSESEHAKESS